MDEQDFIDGPRAQKFGPRLELESLQGIIRAMQNWKHRARAGGIHLGMSLLVALAAAALVFGVWYPYPYRDLSGGRNLFLLVVAVDVVIGPLITLIIFNPAKPRRELITDLGMVAVLQIAALCYGLWTVHAARPVHLVFEYHRLAVVHASDIEPEELSKAPATLRSLPNAGPTLLSLRPFHDANEQYESIMLATSGRAQAAQPALWQPWEQAREAIVQESQPLESLRARYPNHAAEIDVAVARSGVAAAQLRTLPILDRDQSWTALIDTATAKPVAFVPLDSF